MFANDCGLPTAKHIRFRKKQVMHRVLEFLKLSDVEGFPVKHRLLVDPLDLLSVFGDEFALDLRFFQQDLKKL